MGAEGSRYEYTPYDEDDEIFGPGYVQAPPKPKAGVTHRATSTLVDIHNAVNISTDISAIRKLRVSAS